jgi:hypothetical protein
VSQLLSVLFMQALGRTHKLWSRLVPQALHDSGVAALQLNLDLSSFNERKVKLPEVLQLASWDNLTTLMVQESGWRSQQLRVDEMLVFRQLPSLQQLSVVCKVRVGRTHR